MLSFRDRRAGPTALILSLIAWAFAPTAACAAALTLEAAQHLALERDAGRDALEGESAALREMAVAAGQLPDPEARLGAVNLPTDSFALDAEPMTMLEVGIMQRFPAGDSRALSRVALEHRASASEADVADRERMARLGVERAWRELDYLDEALALLSRDERWVDTLVAGLTAEYAAGEGRQTGLIAARLMALELKERRIELAREHEMALAELARWIGEEAGGERVPAPRAAGRPAPLAGLLTRIEAHPRLAALEAQRESAETEVELTAQRYKPSFGLDLSYGFRQGRMEDGASLPDMLTAMVTFDVPLFTRNRQDREASAARAMARAANSRRVDALREMQAQLQAEYVRAVRLAELLELYESQIGSLADLSVEAALSGYRASDGALEDVVEAQRRAIDVRDRLARLRKEYAVSIAEIAYLTGDVS